MPTPPVPFSARALDPVDLPRARELAVACGLHGVYVRNALGVPGDDEGDALALHGQADLLALAWFGRRGNLIVLDPGPLAPDAVADAVRRSGWGWRIVLGPPPVVAALRERCSGQPLVHRQQVYYGVKPAAATRALIRDDVRAPRREDMAALMRAALALNEADLHVDPRRVDRGWLKRMVRGRIDDGSTRVIGPVGRPLSKLDLGSEGAGGLVLEGVFTFPEARGQGLAASLVATVAAAAVRCPVICLHVAADNSSARAAYESAGMRPAEQCSLMLLR